MSRSPSLRCRVHPQTFACQLIQDQPTAWHTALPMGFLHASYLEMSVFAGLKKNTSPSLIRHSRKQIFRLPVRSKSFSSSAKYLLLYKTEIVSVLPLYGTVACIPNVVCPCTTNSPLATPVERFSRDASSDIAVMSAVFWFPLMLDKFRRSHGRPQGAFSQSGRLSSRRSRFPSSSTLRYRRLYTTRDYSW